MVILVDMDDTIEHLLDAWCKALNTRYKTHVNASDITEWNVSSFFPELTNDEVYGILEEEEFWKTVAPRGDAVQYIQQLVDDGDEVYIVTCSGVNTIKSKFNWVIQRYFPSITWDKMIITTKKQMVMGDVLIDDGVHNLLKGNYTKILMTTPANKSFEAEKNGMFRVETWEEVYRIIQRLKEGMKTLKMKVIKRNGDLVDFKKEKITKSIQRANEEAKESVEGSAVTDEVIATVVNRIYERCKKRTRNTSTEEIQKMVAIELMKERAYEVARIYIYNYCRESFLCCLKEE